jgi:8-oxo-dGTP diphosphatase
MIVVAAVIERNGKILIGQRRRDDRHPYKWEFPGGKVEAGESPREALARELSEELGIRAVVGTEMTRYAHRYTSRPIFELIFFRVTEFEGEPRNRVFEQIEWTTAAALPGYDFLDGDVEFVRALARGVWG